MIFFLLGFQNIRLYDIHVNNPSPVLKYDEISKNVTAVGFNDEGKWMYFAGEDGAARIWDRRFDRLDTNMNDLSELQI